MTPGAYKGVPGDLWTYHVQAQGSVVAKHPDGRTKVLQKGSPGEVEVDARVRGGKMVLAAAPSGDRAAVSEAVVEKASRNDLGDLVGSGSVRVEPTENLGESLRPSVADEALRGGLHAAVARPVESINESYMPLKGDAGYNISRRPEVPPNLGESPTSRDTRESPLTRQDVPAKPPAPPPARNPDKAPENLMERIRHVVAESSGPNGQGPWVDNSRPRNGGVGGLGPMVNFLSAFNEQEVRSAPWKKAAAEALAREGAREREYDRDWAVVQETLAPTPAAPWDSTFVGDDGDDDEPPVVRRSRVATGIADRDSPG